MEQRITIEQAIYAYTQASAFAEFSEDHLGRLEPGFLADLVVLDRNPLTAKPQELLQTHVLRTVLGGATVYEAGGSVAERAAPSPAPAPEAKR